MREAEGSDLSVFHSVQKDNNGTWFMQCVTPVKVDGNLEGYLWLFQPMQKLLADLVAPSSGIATFITAKDSGEVAKTPSLSESEVAAFTNGKTKGWLIRKGMVKDLNWGVMTVIPEKTAYAVISRLRNIGLTTLAMSMAAAIAILFFLDLL